MWSSSIDQVAKTINVIVVGGAVCGTATLAFEERYVSSTVDHSTPLVSRVIIFVCRFENALHAMAVPGR